MLGGRETDVGSGSGTDAAVLDQPVLRLR
jgi:hypothetical protein